MPSKTLSVSLPLFLSLIGSFEATTAYAQQDNSATVEALFADGKKLMAQGKTAEACPKFLASYNLDHRVGTELNLAACYEKNAQIASAWARFVDAHTLATRANQAERANFAAQHAAALEPRRSMLTIVVGQPAPGLVVRCDGVVVDPAAYGVAVPVDGGTHTIEAAAPDKKPITATMAVSNESDSKTYTLPPLADEPRPPSAAAAAEATAPKGIGAEATAAPPAPERSSARTIAGIGIAGAGVIALGIGTVFGVEALSKNSASNSNGCVGNVCTPVGFQDRTTARSDGDIASVLIGVGAAAVVGGVVLWLTAPKGGAESASHVVVGVGPMGLDVRGVF